MAGTRPTVTAPVASTVRRSSCGATTATAEAIKRSLAETWAQVLLVVTQAATDLNVCNDHPHYAHEWYGVFALSYYFGSLLSL